VRDVGHERERSLDPRFSTVTFQIEEEQILPGLAPDGPQLNRREIDPLIGEWLQESM
jgi:hypothetical protein